ncbi:hypothetical protein KIL84_011674 [Mauremys mutica]|uniref:Uncharacterized protein n=1 Tax=Mauremys mutica TaxID=74926 RepID=A0A9D4AVK4_9SAUR|nr:hypothetical protein KIL84_011674 [Mauremys mutica]
MVADGVQEPGWGGGSEGNCSTQDQSRHQPLVGHDAQASASPSCAAGVFVNCHLPPACSPREEQQRWSLILHQPASSRGRDQRGVSAPTCYAGGCKWVPILLFRGGKRVSLSLTLEDRDKQGLSARGSVQGDRNEQRAGFEEGPKASDWFCSLSHDEKTHICEQVV